MCADRRRCHNARTRAIFMMQGPNGAMRNVSGHIVGKICYCSKHLLARVAVLAPYSATQTASAGR